MKFAVRELNKDVSVELLVIANASIEYSVLPGRGLNIIKLQIDNAKFLDRTDQDNKIKLIISCSPFLNPTSLTSGK